jgi:tetratricopeptide (TPR) repeat protein
LYRKAVTEGESPALCYYNIGNSYFQLDSLANAIVYYRSCTQNAPDYYKAYMNLAVCYFNLNDLGRCIASIERVLILEPSNQKALMIKAVAMRQCGATAKAVIAFENLLRFYPETEEAYIALGEMYRDLNDLEESVNWLERSPAGGKNSLYVYSLLAEIFEKKGNISKSIFYLNQSFNIDNSKKWTLYNIALMEKQSGNDLVALETCRKGMDLFPDFADMAVLAGTISFEREKIDEAEHFFKIGARFGSSSAIVGLSNVSNWRRAHADF